VRWVGSAREDLRRFPGDAKREAGYQLGRVQQGLMPENWKSMTGVGRGVYEIRVRTGRDFRVFYVATYEEAVYVLHAFEKKTQRTRKADIEVGKRRLAAVNAARSSS
jgi:phage-related protein